MSWGRVVRRNTCNFFGGIEQEEVFETGGIIFGDGRCIELIRDEHGGLSLLDSNQNASESTEGTEFGGRTCVPPSLHPSMLEALTLPIGRVPCGSTTDIFRQIHNLFFDRGILDEAAELFAYFAISAWFPELLPIAPYLAITGPRPEAKMALQLLSCVVRHGLPLGDLNSAGFRSLPMHIQPTLLIGYAHPSMNKMLSVSTYPDAYLPCKDGLIDLYCAKVVYSAAGVADGLYGDAVLKINLGPSRGKLPVVDPGTRRTIAADFQPRLLDYRFKHVVKVRDSGFDVPTLPSGLRILARALAGC